MLQSICVVPFLCCGLYVLVIAFYTFCPKDGDCASHFLSRNYLKLSNSLVGDELPSRRSLLTEKQIERKANRKQKRLEARHENTTDAPSTFIVNVTEDTDAPISILSQTPTPNPSILPTSSSLPSPPSSDVPSPYSSIKVSIEPSIKRSSKLSTEPSIQPSTAPPGVDLLIMDPSSFPSNSPISEISMGPSQRPTTLPSLEPSCNPSDHPTHFPSAPPSSVPSSVPSLLRTTLTCDTENEARNGIAEFIIQFQYEIQHKPSITTAEAIEFADLSVAQSVAYSFLPCPNSLFNQRKLDTKRTQTSFNLTAVDSRPIDTINSTDNCAPHRPRWTCVVVNGAVTALSYDTIVIDVHQIISTIKLASSTEAFNYPGGKSRVRYLLPEPEKFKEVEAPSSQAAGQASALFGVKGQQSPALGYGLALMFSFFAFSAISTLFAIFMYSKNNTNPRVPLAQQAKKRQHSTFIDRPRRDTSMPNETRSMAETEANKHMGNISDMSFLSKDDSFFNALFAGNPNNTGGIREESSDISIGGLSSVLGFSSIASSSSIDKSKLRERGFDDETDVKSTESDMMPVEETSNSRNSLSTPSKWLRKTVGIVERLGIFSDPANKAIYLRE